MFDGHEATCSNTEERHTGNSKLFGDCDGEWHDTPSATIQARGQVLEVATSRLSFVRRSRNESKKWFVLIMESERAARSWVESESEVGRPSGMASN